MNESYENFFYFDTGKIVYENTSVKCPECGEWTIASEWVQLDNYCDVCGDHPALMCPKCNEVYDHVWDDDEEWELK